MDSRVCTECGQKRLLAEYHKKNGKLRSNCKWCVSQYSQAHYKNNKEYYLTKAARNRTLGKQRLRRFIYEYYSSHPCVDCGESDPIVLEFDHIHKKYAGIAIMINRMFSLEKIKNEIERCEVVCSNCHKRRTAKQFDWYKDVIKTKA